VAEDCVGEVVWALGDNETLHVNIMGRIRVTIIESVPGTSCRLAVRWSE
jgi:hypothetical protein